MGIAFSVSNLMSPFYIESIGGKFQIVFFYRMAFVCSCFNVKWIALFVYKEYVKRTLSCGSGNSEGLLLSHHFIYLFIYFPDKTPSPPLHQGHCSCCFLPGKSFTLSLFMTSFSLDVKAFLKCHLFLEAFVDFSYEKNPQFPAQSPSQMKKWRSYKLCTVSLYRVCYDYTRLYLSCLLAYS